MIAEVQKKEGEMREGKPDMVAIRWCQPNSVYDGVVQFVSKSLVKSIDGDGNATVLWPRKGHEPDVWTGTVEPTKAASSQPKSKQNQITH